MFHTAKGLAYALSVPVIALDSMESLLSQEVVKREDAIKVPMLDARRMEVYSGVYDEKGNQLRSIEAEVVEADSLKEYWSKKRVILFGPGADKCEEIFHGNDQVQVLKSVYPSASSMVISAYKLYQEKQFVDTAYFEPYYLKDFVAGKPKKLL